MVRPNSVSNNLTRITKALQAWQINWNIHGVHIHLSNPVNNLAIPHAVIPKGAACRYCATYPPSTGTLAPVINEALSEHSQTIRLATSSAVPIRPIGCNPSIIS